MSYVVCHVQKFKSGDVKGLQLHNQREREYSKNKDIDKSKSELNYDLHNDQTINYNHRVKAILGEGYKGKRAIRKDATIMTSTVISSDGDFFKDLSDDEKRRFFEQSYNYFKEFYGEKNIIAAQVHLDETTPHMHLCAVPLTSDGRLSAKTIITRENLRKFQDDLPRLLKDKGFNVKRGIESSSVQHIDIHELKKKTTEKLRTELDAELEKYNKLSHTVIERTKSLKDTIGLIEEIKPKKRLLGSDLTITQRDYDTLRVKAEFGEAQILKNKELKMKIDSLDKKNCDLKDKVENLERVSKYYKNEKKVLEKKIKNLDKDSKGYVSKLKLILDYLDKNNKLDECLNYINKIENENKIKQNRIKGSIDFDR